MPNDKVDQDILKIAHGDIEAFEKLYIELKKSVFLFAFSICKNYEIAEDIMQDTFIAIWKKSKTYKAKGYGKTWIMSIAKNISKEYLRKENRTSNLDEWTQEIISQEIFEDKIIWNSILLELDGIDRDIVIMHGIVGLKHREISNALNLPLGTVLWKYNKSMKKLRQLLEKEM